MGDLDRTSSPIGWPDNLVDPPDNSTGLHLQPADVWYDIYAFHVGPKFPLGLWCSLVGIATIFVGLRMYARWRSVGGIRLDDYVLLAAWLASLGNVIPFLIVKNDQALGFDGTVYPSDEQIKAAQNVLKAFYAALNFGNLSVTLAKTSLIILYWILLDGIQATRKWLLIFTVFFAVASLGQQLAMALACMPFSEQWTLTMDYYNYVDTTDIAIGASQCIMVKEWIVQIYHGCLSVVTDICIFIFSIPLLKRAGLRKREAIGICAMFSLSLVTMGSSIATIVVATINPELTAGLTWGISEVSIGLIVASMVSLRSLFNDIFNICRRWIHHSRTMLKNKGDRDDNDTDLERRLTGSTRISRMRSREIRELEFRTELGTKRANRWWDEECIKERDSSKESSRGRTLMVAFGIGSRTSSQSNSRANSRPRGHSHEEEEVEESSTVPEPAELAPVILRG